MPIQRAWIGLSGPGGMTLPPKSPAQAELGTCQDGLTSLFSIAYSPAGVSNPTRPTAMPYVLAILRSLYSVSWNAPRLTMMIAGYFAASWASVTFGWTALVWTRTVFGALVLSSVRWRSLASVLNFTRTPTDECVGLTWPVERSSFASRAGRLSLRCTRRTSRRMAGWE